MNALFSDLGFPFPEFQVGHVAFDGTSHYIFIFCIIHSPNPCQHFMKGRFIYILEPKPQNRTFEIVFKNPKNADTDMNFSYLAILLLNFKSVVKKLPELESRVPHSFDIKIVLRKKLLKVLASHQPHFQWNFSVSNLILYMRYSFFAILKLYL